MQATIFGPGQQGFTLIELVIVITILGILATFALPRFIEVEDRAHDANIEATGGAMAAAVALLRAQWFANGTSVADADGVAGFGKSDVNSTADGWPASVGAGGGTTTAMTAPKCVDLWAALLQSNAPEVATSAGTADYVASAAGTVCTYTYQADGSNSTITYDASDGEVQTTLL